MRLHLLLTPPMLPDPAVSKLCEAGRRRLAWGNCRRLPGTPMVLSTVTSAVVIGGRLGSCIRRRRLFGRVSGGILLFGARRAERGDGGQRHGARGWNGRPGQT